MKLPEDMDLESINTTLPFYGKVWESLNPQFIYEIRKDKNLMN